MTDAIVSQDPELNDQSSGGGGLVVLLVAILALASFGGVIMWQRQEPEQFVSTATLMVEVMEGLQPSATEIAQQAPAIVRSEKVLNDAIHVGQLSDVSSFGIGALDLRDHIQVSTEAGSPLIRISVTSGRVSDASTACQAVVLAYKRFIEDANASKRREEMDVLVRKITRLSKDLQETEAFQKKNQEKITATGADHDRLKQLSHEVTVREVAVATLSARYETTRQHIADAPDEATKQAVLCQILRRREVTNVAATVASMEAELNAAKAQQTAVATLRDSEQVKCLAARNLEIAERNCNSRITELIAAHETGIEEVKRISDQQEHPAPKVVILTPGSRALLSPNLD